MAGLIGHLEIHGPDRGWQIDTKYPIFESTYLDHDIKKFHKYHQYLRTNPAEALKKE